MQAGADLDHDTFTACDVPKSCSIIQNRGSFGLNSNLT